MSVPLSSTIKIFILNQLAAFRLPSEVAEAVRAEFGVEVSIARVCYYDPNSVAGSKLGAKWKEIFEAARTKFLEELERLPMAHRSVRLDRLDSLYHKSLESKNLKGALTAVSIAQKEMRDLDYREPDDEGGEW